MSATVDPVEYHVICQKWSAVARAARTLAETAEKVCKVKEANKPIHSKWEEHEQGRILAGYRDAEDRLSQVVAELHADISDADRAEMLAWWASMNDEWENPQKGLRFTSGQIGTLQGQ